MNKLTPREIVRELDRYIVGQDEAKRAVAVALRNRYRRAQLPAEIREEISQYIKSTHLLFSLESLKNLANNGRVSPVVATMAGILGIRLVGKASNHGTLEPMHKCRGEKKALDTILAEMRSMGYKGGKVRIGHSLNLNAAQTLEAAIRKEYPNADITIIKHSGLCCFYSEKGGVLVGFEGANKFAE